jgi:ABC-2 type transport system ATP-binding protein
VTRRIHEEEPAIASPVDDRARVAVSSLTKRFGEIVAVDDLTFSLSRGTVTGFLGPNGAGKTTTLRLLLGLAEPTAGEALVFGRRYRELDNPARRIGAVLESSDFHPGRSGRDHLRALAFAAEIAPGRVEEVLELVELDAAASRRVRTYSLGMRQRLGLAAALLGDPELLVLDEPANGLDPAGIRWLREVLRSFAAQGRTVLVSSHLLSEVEQTVDRVVIVGAGRLVREGSMEQLRSGADGAGTVLVRGPEMGRLAEVLSAGGTSVSHADGALTVTGSTPAEVGHRAFAAGIELHELRPHTSGLEEIYFQLTAGTEQFSAPTPGSEPTTQEAAR